MLCIIRTRLELSLEQVSANQNTMRARQTASRRRACGARSRSGREYAALSRGVVWHDRLEALIQQVCTGPVAVRVPCCVRRNRL